MSDEKQKGQSQIVFNIELDEENVPEEIRWKSTGEEEKESKAFLLSIWDEEEKHALRLDLWTKEMRVDEMNVLFFETLMTMAESYERATQSGSMAAEMRRFARYFGEKTELLKKEEGEPGTGEKQQE